jgi:hypothetical protein
MKFPKGAKIEKIVSKDLTKRIMLNPWLDVESSSMLASNNSNALRIPVEVQPGDVSGPVPVELIKEARKSTCEIACNEDYCIGPNGVAYPRGAFSAFPNVAALLIPGETTGQVSLNAKLLYELASSMGCEVVKLRLQGDRVVLVTPHPSEPHIVGAEAALAPYRVPTV